MSFSFIFVSCHQISVPEKQILMGLSLTWHHHLMQSPLIFHLVHALRSESCDLRPALWWSDGAKLVPYSQGSVVEALLDLMFTRVQAVFQLVLSISTMVCVHASLSILQLLRNGPLPFPLFPAEGGAALGGGSLMDRGENAVRKMVLSIQRTYTDDS